MNTNPALTRISWQLNIKGRNASREQIIKEYVTAFQFFDVHGLTTRQLIPDDQVINDDFAVYANDLTEEGRELFKTGYQKYLNSIDRGTEIEKAQSLLGKYLNKIRGKG